MKEILEQLGKNIEKERKERKWSQSKLARKLGTNQGHISKYERGERSVTLVTVYRIAKVFRISLGRLLKGIRSV